MEPPQAGGPEDRTGDAGRPNGADPSEEVAPTRTQRVLGIIRLTFVTLFSAALVLLFGWMIVGSLLTDGQPPPRHRLERVEGRLEARRHWHEPFYKTLPSQYLDTYELRLAGQPGRFEIRNAQYPDFRRAAFEREVALGAPVVLLVEPGERVSNAPEGNPRAGMRYRAVYGVTAAGTVYLDAGPAAAGDQTGPVWLGPNGRLTRAAVGLGLAGLFAWGLLRGHRRRQRTLRKPPVLRPGARWR